MFTNVSSIKEKRVIWVTVLYVIAALLTGYWALGLVPSFLFSLGFVTGFVVWLVKPDQSNWKRIRLPYSLTLIFFIAHKVEEKRMNFFPELSRLTGVPVPEADSAPAILLLVIAGAWILIPFLMVRGSSFGFFLAWTFFTAMGITELAHFFFPFFTGDSYKYFPGMWTVIFVAPAGWWGMIRLGEKSKN